MTNFISFKAPSNLTIESYYSQKMDDYDHCETKTNSHSERSKENLNIVTSILRSQLELKNFLYQYYEFDSDELSIIDFINSKSINLKFLTSIQSYINDNFAHKKISLDLLEEDNDWKTLFINVYSREGWKSSRDFKNKFLDNLISCFHDMLDYVNINIIHV